MKENKLIWGCVDLGLPSGTLWATMNVGATSETDSGLYFACGNTQGYKASQVGNGRGQKAFSWNGYNLGSASSFSKYNSTNRLTTLKPADDAAYALSNGQYIMPTRKQFKELIENTNSKWDDERKGCVFVSKINGRELFFPAVGGCSDGSVNDAGLFGYYWSSSLKSSNADFAWYLVLISGEEMEMSIDNRCFGNSVRGVLLQK